MDTLTDSPVTLTPGAIMELKRLVNEEASATGKYLRIGVKGGGCSGMTYVLNFEEKQDRDDVYTIDDLNYIIDPSHEMYLFGMQVHYENGLNSRGFTFQNPNASKTCGCGTSFAV